MSVYDGLKDAAKVLQEAGKIEQYKQILEAQEKLLELQKKIAEIENENTSLKDKLKVKGELKLVNHSYWIGDDGPYCTRCWDADNKLVRLHPDGNPAFYNCPNCKCGSVKAKPDQDRPVQQFHVRRQDFR